MLALIAGQGALPDAVRAAHDGPVIVCGLAHSPPDGLRADRLFRLEELGDVLRWLKREGVRAVCMCGAITRPPLEFRHLTLRTLPLVPRVWRALKRGDDGALRIAAAIFEGAGFAVLGAHEAAPGLLPAPGARGGPLADWVYPAASLGDMVSAEQGRQDLGQACVVNAGHVLAREDDAGTDAMLRRLGPDARGALLYKAPKQGQDRRFDLPVIGPETARMAAAAGLAGIVVESDGVMVLDQRAVHAELDAHGLFLWVRKRGA